MICRGQDDIHFGHSTNQYLTFIQGGIVEATSFLPQIMLHSFAEATYLTATHSILPGSFIPKVNLESLGINPGQPFGGTCKVLQLSFKPGLD
jgi:hypothetical protein